MKMYIKYFLFLSIAVFVIACGNAGSSSSEDNSDSDSGAETTTNDGTDEDNVVTNLTLPISIDDISVGRMINSFGVVRSSADLAEFGHVGIDLPIPNGNSFLAVADGIIVSADDADGKNGKDVWLFLGSDASGGEGWIFRYEGIDLTEGLAVDSSLSQGDVIGTSNITEEGLGTHLELSFGFENFTFTSSATCWVNQLESAPKTNLENYFNNTLRVDADFISSWQTITMEGKLPWKELIDDTDTYPDGVQLCYPAGTDVRIDAS